MNDSLRPLPRAGGPSDAASSVSTLLSDSFDSYNGDDAQRYLHEWRMAQNRYSEATWENDQLEIRLRSLRPPFMRPRRRPAPSERDWQNQTPWWRVR